MTEHTHDDGTAHTHDEEPLVGESGYFPPAEMQVEMLLQENERLNKINLNLRMQGSFQVQIIESLKEQIGSISKDIVLDQPAPPDPGLREDGKPLEDASA